MEMTETFTALGVSLGLGLLVGIQRERAEARRAGVRTFALITVLGSIAALLAETYGGWVVAAALGGVIVAEFASSLRSRDAEYEVDPGTTTDIAVLVMFAVGVLVVKGPIEVAVAIGGTVLVLLHLKVRLHAIAERLSDRDVTAIVQFALITLVVLPVLPNRTFGPFDVLNPRHIWLMVVLVVGVSLLAYVAYKLLGERAGIVVGGIFGGLLSSTATTASMARRARKSRDTAAAVLVVTIASAVAFPRVAVEIAVVAPGHAVALATPLAIVFATFLLALAVTVWRSRGQTVEFPEPGNPTELRSAILFAALFAAVLFVVAAGQHYFGDRGLFVVAALSGLTDVDAITLSTARLVQEERVTVDTGWRGILLATLTNLGFKAGIAGALGGAQMFRRTVTMFVPALVAGAVLLAVWRV